MSLQLIPFIFNDLRQFLMIFEIYRSFSSGFDNFCPVFPWDYVKFRRISLVFDFILLVFEDFHGIGSIFVGFCWFS